MHGEWHGAELATGVSEQAIAISTATSATHGRNAATTAARGSALAVKRVQNPRLTLEQLRPRAGVASAVQEHPEVPGQGWGQLRRAGSSTVLPRELGAVGIPAPLQCTVDANRPPQPVLVFTSFSCTACLQMFAS